MPQDLSVRSLLIKAGRSKSEAERIEADLLRLAEKDRNIEKEASEFASKVQSKSGTSFESSFIENVVVGLMASGLYDALQWLILLLGNYTGFAGRPEDFDTRSKAQLAEGKISDEEIQIYESLGYNVYRELKRSIKSLAKEYQENHYPYEPGSLLPNMALLELERLIKESAISKFEPKTMKR